MKSCAVMFRFRDFHRAIRKYSQPPHVNNHPVDSILIAPTTETEIKCSFLPCANHCIVVYCIVLRKGFVECAIALSIAFESPVRIEEKKSISYPSGGN
ncbi:hypothetical protein EYC80_004238 [Monilinia laxa]|uniref:Uncharacterized protein n=1 Tax=Monilinia laxa TaxID=61186 RepID=A0A5N6KM77_MONLA|nr:hypothetical protein EYC80_004238 [Monilinia laxa]